MNKIVASVGLAAIGVSGANAVAQDLYAAPPKPWKVSAALRGFYDDNINTAPSSSKQDAWGYEIEPGVSLDIIKEQTILKLAYQYTFRYYDNRPAGQTEKYDQNHMFTALVQHAFNERYRISVQDSFVVGQEPDFLRAQLATSEFQRVPGSNIRNYGNIKFNAEITPIIGAEVGYGNAYYNYDDSGGNALVPSLSGTLDRMEHAIHIDGRWMFSPKTVGVVGYQYGQVDYLGDEDIGLVSSGIVRSDDRNSRSHYGYLGVDQKFTPDLTGSIRAGIRYSDYYNSPLQETDTSPYALASLRYIYAPESFLEAGFSYDRSSTDQLNVDFANDSISLDQDSAVLFGSVHHRFRPRLFGSVLAQYQHSTYNGGTADGEADNFFLLGLNLQYHFGPDLMAEIGYNYDHLSSEVHNDFSRNRVYIGMTASY
jgi:hypothetical protein